MAKVLSTTTIAPRGVADLGDRLDVEAGQQRVGRRLEPHHADVVGPVAPQRVEVGEVDGGPREPERAPHLGDQPERAAVGVVAEQDPLAGPQQPQDVVLGGEAAREGEAVRGLLERGDLGLERRAGRVARARVLESLVTADAVLGERGRQRDRRDDRAGGRLGVLAGVDRPGGEPVACGRIRRGHPSSDTVPEPRSRAASAMAVKYDEHVGAGEHAERTAAGQHEQRRRGFEHLDGQFDLLADADRGELRSHHLLDRGRHHAGVAVDGLHQFEFVDRSGHLGGGERRRVLAHRQLADAGGAHQLDRLGHQLLRVDVEQVLDRCVAGVEHGADALVALAQEPEVRHPVVVEHPSTGSRDPSRG